MFMAYRGMGGTLSSIRGRANWLSTTGLSFFFFLPFSLVLHLILLPVLASPPQVCRELGVSRPSWP